MNTILVLVCTLTMANGQTHTTTSQHFYSERGCANQWDRGDREHCSCETLEQRWQKNPMKVTQ